MKKKSEGVTVCGDSTVFSSKFQDRLLDLEEDSWWFSYRANVIIRLMDFFFSKVVKTIDVGGGNGYTTLAATRHGYNMELLEPSEAACRNAAERGVKTYCGVLDSEYPEDGEYDQVLLLDVLEHIEDDRGFLKLLNKKMKNSGVLLITVPAFMGLWSSNDYFSGHYRRYNKRNLCMLLEQCGFSVLYKNYFMSFLVGPILVFRVLFEKIGIFKDKRERTAEQRDAISRAELKSKSKVVNTVLYLLERIELLFLKKQNSILFGGSVIAVAKVRKEQ